MKLTPLAPVLPDDGAGPRWGLAASATVHGLLLLALLALAARSMPPGEGASPSYELVFETPNAPASAPATNAPRTQALPPAQPADVSPPPDAISGVPAPNPDAAPDPNATTAPPPAAPPPPPPLATTPPPSPALAPVPVPRAATVAPPTPAQSTPPPVVEAPPEAEASLPLPVPRDEPPALEPPAVRLEVPPTNTPAATEAAPIMPEPPPPLPSPPKPPQPQPRPRVQAPPRSQFGSLSNPMDLSFGPSPPPARRGSVASRSLDLSPPQESQGPARSDPYAQIRAANASADWNRGLLQYWLRHRYYPEQAAEQGDQGAVTIQLTVNRSGRVESVEVISRSGSQWLDMAAVGTWRNAQLPPFTNEMREDRITFPIPIQYYLVRR